MTGWNYELRELGSEYPPEPVHQATAEAPSDSLRSLEATEPREQDASPCRADLPRRSPAQAEALRRRAEFSLDAIRPRLIRCLKSRANPQPLVASKLDEGADWALLLEQTEYFA